MTRLKKWYICSDCFTEDRLIRGIAEGKKSFMDERDIGMIPLTDLVDAGDYYIACTIDGMFELDKKTERVPDNTDKVLNIGSRMRRAAEKLLLPGDSLYCMHRVLYCSSEDGLIRDLPVSRVFAGCVYSFPDEEFEFVHYDYGQFSLKYKEENKNCRFYRLELIAKRLRSYSYATANDHRYSRELPF